MLIVDWLMHREFMEIIYTCVDPVRSLQVSFITYMLPVSMYQNIRYMLMLLLKSNYFSLYDFDRRFSIDDNLQHCSVSYCLLWFYSFNYITVTWQHKFSIMPAYFLQCPILVWVMIHTFTCFAVSRDRKERFHRGSILRLLYRDRGLW